MSEQIENSPAAIDETIEPVAPNQEQPRQRLRLIYEKGEAIKFISHMDEFRLWERTLRRASLPLLYKLGFNPQPFMQFASPLGVGITGAREPIDITLSPPLPLAAVEELLRAKLPPGVTLHAIEEVAARTESLQSLLIGADYTILIYAEPGELAEDLLPQRIAEFLAQTAIPRERERKGEKYQYNLRPLVFELCYEGYTASTEEHRIFLRVQQRNGATGRPDEVLAALGLDDFARTLRRERLYYSNEPADVATFAGYPVVTQQEIALASASRQTKPWEKERPAQADRPQATGRSISERAGDEFV